MAPRKKTRWFLLVVLLLVAWALRLCCLEEVPPGWRDDELINIHALAGRLLRGDFPLYYAGASGHEPLYHHLHAGVHAILGFNVLSGHILSVAWGLLSIPLAYVLARRLFGRTVGFFAAGALALSFWSLMYSRTAIRHINLPPLMLAAFYGLWRLMADRARSIAYGLLTGVALAGCLYTYPAARLLPVMVILFGGYLALFHRTRFRRCWRGLLVALLVAGALVTPMIVAIQQGRSEAAAEGIGADARLAELAVPLRELRQGNPRPLLKNVWTTLGMFHATGDAEWLYNVAGRPVLGWAGGLLFWAGVGLCILRWRRARYTFLVLWLGTALAPTFVSIPPASLSHTIMAQPLAYLLPVLFISEMGRAFKQPERSIRLALIAIVAALGVRDLRDYFVNWPQRGMVRVLYRADYRDAAAYLNARPAIDDVAIGSSMLGPWDRLALEVDTEREAAAFRIFDPQRALVWPEGIEEANVILTDWPEPAPEIAHRLEMVGEENHLALSTAQAPATPEGEPLASFANGLTLETITWQSSPEEIALLATWRVDEPLDLPPIPIVANPPPPGAYSGPRLAVFAHLLDDEGVLLAGDDGFWIDPLTLRTGDRFLFIHRFRRPAGTDLPLTLGLGVYDPKTGERWAVTGGAAAGEADRIELPVAD